MCCRKSEHINQVLLLNLVELSTVLFSNLTAIRNLVIKYYGIVYERYGNIINFGITWLFAYCKGSNFNIHIWVWFGYFIC